MATTQDEIDALFNEDAAKPAEDAEPATQLSLDAAPEPGSIDELKDKAAKIRAGKASNGKAGKASRPASSASAPSPSASSPADADTLSSAATSAPLAATDGVSPNAKDELARLAARREGQTDADAIPDKIEGLTTEPGYANLYEQRQAELAEAKARGKKPKGRKLTDAQKAKAAAAKAKEAEKEKARKAKEAEKVKAEKAKAAEAKKKTAKQESAERRKKMEEERKAKQAAEKAAKAAERALKAVPDLISRENKATQAAFAEDYKLAAPKGERNPEGQGVRRAKADRGDFAAGWLMAMRRVRRDLKAQAKGATQGVGSSGE